MLVFFNLYKAHIFTKTNVLRNFTVVFTIPNKNVSYSADGVSLHLCACPCKSAHNINSIHDLWTVHSNVLYIPFKAKNIEEIVMKHTHIKKKPHNHRTKKNNSIKRLRWIYVYVKLTWTVFITTCVWDVKNMKNMRFKSRSFHFLFFFYLEKSCRNVLFLCHFCHKSLIVVLCAANGDWDVLLKTSRSLAVDCCEW